MAVEFPLTQDEQNELRRRSAEQTRRAMFWRGMGLTLVVLTVVGARGALKGEDELLKGLREKALCFAYPTAMAILTGLALSSTMAPGAMWWSAPVSIALAGGMLPIAYLYLQVRADRG